LGRCGRGGPFGRSAQAMREEERSDAKVGRRISR